MRFKLSMCTAHVQTHINIAFLLPSKNFTFIFYAYLISRHIGNWIVKNNETKKKVVAKVVDFPDFDI